MNSFVQSAWKIGTDNLQLQQGAFQGWLNLFSELMKQQNELLAFQLQMTSKLLNGMGGDEDRRDAEVDLAEPSGAGSSPRRAGRTEAFSFPPVLLNPTRETVYQWLENLREQQPTNCG